MSEMGFTGLESRYQLNCIFFWRLYGRIYFLTLSASRGGLLSWFPVPFFYLQGQWYSIFFKSFFLSLIFCPPFVRVLVIISGSMIIHHLKILNLFICAMSLLLCKVTFKYSLILGLRAWTSLGGHYSVHHRASVELWN